MELVTDDDRRCRSSHDHDSWIKKPTLKHFVPSPYSPTKVHFQWPPENDSQPTMKTLLERAWRAKRRHDAMRKDQLAAAAAAAAPEESKRPAAASNLLVRRAEHVELQAKKKIKPAAAPAAASDLLVRRGKLALTVEVPPPVALAG